jgi:hypothetical protein
MPFRKDEDMVALLSHLMDGHLMNGPVPASQPRVRAPRAAFDARGNVIELVSISAFVQTEYQKLVRRLGDVEVHNVARVLGDGALLLSCSAPTGQFVLRIESSDWHWRRPVC